MTDETNMHDIKTSRKVINNLPAEPTLSCTQKPIGKPPRYFDDEQKTFWNEVITDVADCDFQPSDRIALENCCLLIQQKSANPIEFMASKYKMLKDHLKSFGMTPDTRPNIVIPVEPEANPFDVFI